MTNIELISVDAVWRIWFTLLMYWLWNMLKWRKWNS